MTPHPPSPSQPPRIGVCADPVSDQRLEHAADRLAAALGLPEASSPDAEGFDVLLVVTPERIELRVLTGDSQLIGGKPIAIDLSTIDTRSPMGRSLRQPLLRAVGLRKGEAARPTLLDATAGYGEDSWLLASMGCDVLAVERMPVMAALLSDAIRRAARHDAEAASRLVVTHADSIELLHRLGRGEADPAVPPQFRKPDVVYLDPMFPSGRRARERKPLRVLRWLVGEDPDAGDLLTAALAAARSRVVVKRPLKAAPVPGPASSSTHKGRAVRYDVYGV